MSYAKTPEGLIRQRANLKPPWTKEQARQARELARPALERHYNAIRANSALRHAQAGHTKSGAWIKSLVERLAALEARVDKLSRGRGGKPKRKPAGQAQAQPQLDGSTAPSPAPAPTAAPLAPGQSWSPSPDDAPPTLDR